LLAIDGAAVSDLIGALRDEGTLASADIGELIEGPPGRIEVLP
jgi:hypothetical protein